MKLSKNLCWTTFQTAAMHKVPSFYSDGFVYDIIYIAGDYMIANKRRLKTTVLTKVSYVHTDKWTFEILNTDDGYMLAISKEDITTEKHKDITDMADGTPLIIEDGEYKPLPQRGKNK